LKKKYQENASEQYNTKTQKERKKSARRQQRKRKRNTDAHDFSGEMTPEILPMECVRKHPKKGKAK
jgi:hypothetical protein